MTKVEARDYFLNKRNLLDKSRLLNLNQQITKWFFDNIDLSSTKIIHTYLSIEARNEVDTWPIIERLRHDHRQIKIVVPKMNAAKDGLDSYLLDVDKLKPNHLGILEPEDGEVVLAKEIDLIIVPLIAYDKLGNRAGYGKGYYDKYLKTVRNDCLKIGLSFFEPVEEIENVNENDVALDMCVTPEEVYEF